MNWLYATSPLTYVLHQFISSYSFKCLIVGKFQATVEEVREPAWLGKTNFVEIRSFWHIFRSFDRMWSFLILALQVCLGRALCILNSLALQWLSRSFKHCSSLQAMVIMASHDLDSPLQVFDATILEDVMSIFITSAALKLIKGVFIL